MEIFRTEYFLDIIEKNKTSSFLKSRFKILNAFKTMSNFSDLFTSFIWQKLQLEIAKRKTRRL